MTGLAGVVTPIMTPFEENGEIANDLWVAHAKWILAEGGHYLSPFGTTGEALSVSMRARMAAVEALVDAGIPADRLVPGTGLCSLEETRRLTAHARDLGCAGVMTLPPFFYTGASEDGLVRYFSELIDAEGQGALKLVLYHIPSHAGVGISPSLAARLNTAFPEIVVGYKDSSGDWGNTQAVIDAAPGLGVFPGSEAFLTKGLAAGGVGCISATCNINVGQIRRLYDGASAGEDVAALDAEVKSVRKTIQDAGLIPAMKALLAERLNEPRWRNVLAPLTPPEASLGATINAALGSAASHIAA
ncbi:dihydrodipicolinate synthase family protein [Rhodobacteraceae bacterium NNCM2]|nr:dihydrodipicolinate synthase family protein [Coraliihabitans acroporae]